MSVVFLPTEVKLVSIKSLINAVAGTTEDRVEILKNRDKIIRNGTSMCGQFEFRPRPLALTSNKFVTS